MEQEVEVEGTGAPALAALAAGPALEEFQYRQQGFWSEVGTADNGAVEIERLAYSPDGLRFVQAADTEVRQSLGQGADRGGEPRFAIAEVAAERDGDP